MSNCFSKVKGAELEQIEGSLKEAENEENKLVAAANGSRESVKAEEKLVAQARTDVAQDEAALSQKEKELEKVGELFKSLKEKCDRDLELYAAAQERFEKVSAGFLLGENGESATLEQQLMSAKQNLTKARTEMERCEMRLKHGKEQLAKKQTEMRSTENEYRQDGKNLESVEAELKSIEDELGRLGYVEGARESLEEASRRAGENVRALRSRVDSVEMHHSQLRFQYQDPEPNFNRDSVKGLVCKLLTIKDRSAAAALELAAGGRVG